MAVLGGIDAAVQRIRAHLSAGRPVTWLELGAYALNPAAAEHSHRVLALDHDLVCPIPWHQLARFERPGDGPGWTTAGGWV